MDIERSFDAERLNAIVNHPDIRPDVADASEGALDLTAIVNDKRNVLVSGEYGSVMYRYVLPCLYEAHTQILPEGRGEWAVEFTKATGEYMFTKTNAFELATRIPQTHAGAKALAVQAGFKYEFTRDDNCKFRGEDVPVDIYSSRLQDWMSKAKGMKEVGESFHKHLHAEAERLGIGEKPHDNDENHNQYVGACLKMLFGGQLDKALIFYNRWALLSRHAPITLIAQQPPVIKFDIGLLRMNGNRIEDLEVILCQ